MDLVVELILKLWEANKPWIAGGAFVILVFLWLIVFFKPESFERFLRLTFVVLLVISVYYANDISGLFFGFFPKEPVNEYLVGKGITPTLESRTIAEDRFWQGGWLVFQTIVVLIIALVEIFNIDKEQF